MSTASNEFENPLPGVPLIESPFFDRIFVEGAYPAETLRLARQIRENGFTVLDFPDEEIDEMADRIIDDVRGKYDWGSWRAGKIDSLRIIDHWQRNDDVRRIATNQKILDLLATLYGRRAFPFQTLNFAVGTQQHVHTDSAHFSCNPERFMCGVWVALEDIDADNGPLIYCPGSHKWPIYTNEHIGKDSGEFPDTFGIYPYYEQLWSSLIDVHQAEIKRFKAKKGQALIWAANLLHGGDKMNDLDRTRWSQVTHYFFEGCSYYTPIHSELFHGSIYFRELRNVGSGESVAHSVSGRPVDPTFVAEARHRALYRGEIPAGFDGEAYLKLNPDVAAAGADPLLHYLQNGRREGRRWR
jgi:hypothetical protein